MSEVPHVSLRLTHPDRPTSNLYLYCALCCAEDPISPPIRKGSWVDVEKAYVVPFRARHARCRPRQPSKQLELLPDQPEFD